jgi:hypothetical protein
MLLQRKRALLIAAAAMLLAWALSLGGYWWAKSSKMTAAKVRGYAESVDLSKLTGRERAEAIDRFAAKLNALPTEERQQARFDRLGMKWFDQMTEAERGDFVEKTLPTGFKQMISSFEQLPEAKRREALDRALRDLRQQRQRADAGELPSGPGGQRGEPPPELSPEMQEQIKKIGLRTYFTEASAQTKAELAPLLEELQRMMEGGRMILGGRPGR